MPMLPKNTLLMIIDFQKAIDEPYWGTRNNPDAEMQVALLLDTWRTAKMPVLHVQHMSTDPDSAYRPDCSTNAFKEEVLPLPGEDVLKKDTNSAFIRTDLDSWLKHRGVNDLVIVGVITNNSIEATARMAGNLGYRTVVISDATFTFGREDFGGQYHAAEVLHNIALGNLDGEYATVLSTEELKLLICHPEGK